jgi:hypothetical protein
VTARGFYLIMAVLNETFVFERDASPDDRRAFRGAPTRQLLPVGAKLYRFVTPTNNEILKGRWWYSKETFRRILQLAATSGSSVSDTVRSRLAITKDWNPTLDWMCQVQLTKPVYAWCGATQYQPLSTASRKVLLPGNFEQIYLPNLPRTPASLASDHAMIMYYGEVNSL